MTMARPAFTIAGLRKSVAANSVPVLITTFTMQNVLRIVSNLVLTRLLAPEAFGVVGVISSINFVLQLLTDAGFYAFVVRSPHADDWRFRNIIWTIRLIRSAVLTTVMFVFAGALAAAFDKPELETPVRAASFLFLLEGVRSLHPITAERARRISYISIVEFSAFLLQMATTITAAYLTKSYWALIIGLYAGDIATAVFSYALYPGGFHRIAFDRETSRELWRFSRFIVSSSIITIVLNQTDKVFIGRALSLDGFGLYMLAANLTAASLALVRAYVIRILFPLFAETARNAAETLDKVYYSARRRMTAILAFLIGGGVGGGHLAVRILFDERYLSAGFYVSLLLLVPLFTLITLPAEQFTIVKGHVRATLEANIVRLIWILVSAPLGLHFFGVIGLVCAFALMEVATAVYWWFRLTRMRVLNLREEAVMLAAAGAGMALGFAADKLVESLIASGVLPAF